MMDAGYRNVIDDLGGLTRRLSAFQEVVERQIVGSSAEVWRDPAARLLNAEFLDLVYAHKRLEAEAAAVRRGLTGLGVRELDNAYSSALQVYASLCIMWAPVSARLVHAAVEAGWGTDADSVAEASEGVAGSLGRS